MFVDIHCHALPGVDDGAKNWDMAMNMFRQAREQEISHLVLTPHFVEGDPAYSPAQVLSAFEQAKQRAYAQGVKLELLLGNEVFLDARNLKRLKDGQCLTINESNYVLLELPGQVRSDTLDSLVYDLQLEGYEIVLAHVERYDGICQDRQALGRLLAQGVLLQVNASSLVSEDKRLRRRALRLVQDGFVHLVASDAHNDGNRRCRMKEAYEVVLRRYGTMVANILFIENPLRVVRNKHVEASSADGIETGRMMERIGRLWKNMKR